MKVRNGFISNSSSCSFVVRVNPERSKVECPCCGNPESLTPIEYIKKHINYVGYNKIIHPTDLTPELYDNLKESFGEGFDSFFEMLINESGEELYLIDIHNGIEENKLRNYILDNPNIEIIKSSGP